MTVGEAKICEIFTISGFLPNYVQLNWSTETATQLHLYLFKFFIWSNISITAGAPSITGYVLGVLTFAHRADNGYGGVFNLSSPSWGTATQGNSDWCTVSLDASRVSSTYGTSNTIRPISKQVRFMLRY